MPKITFDGKEYIVDHAAKGPNYVHGYDVNGNILISIEGISDFSLIAYDGTYVSPATCLAEPCNDVKYCGGALKTRGGALVPAGHPNNLLDNSDFSNPVNQRNQSSYGEDNPDYSDPEGYTIDRWRTPAKVRVVPSDSYVRIFNASTTATNGFTQHLEKIPAVGTPLTLVMTDSDGEVHAGSVKFPESDYVTAFTCENGVTGRVYSHGSVVIALPTGETMRMRNIGLYEGEYAMDMLPQYQPKGFAHELLECMRYFQVIKCAIGPLAQNNDTTYYPLMLHMPMREAPNVMTIWDVHGILPSQTSKNCVSLEITEDISDYGTLLLYLSADIPKRS